MRPIPKQNNLVSLAPSYQTSFRVQGEAGTIHFECHYFDVATSISSVSTSALVGRTTRSVLNHGIRRGR